MASAGMKASDSRPASQAAPPEIGTSNTKLCEVCLQALTINDQLAGGTTRVNASDGTTTLDISGFIRNDWSVTGRGAIPEERLFTFRGKEGREAPKWVNRSAWHSDPHKRTRQYRRLCVGNRYERLVTLPRMLELSLSAVVPCRLCSRLRALFIGYYAGRSWWNEPGSTLRFTMQYEWTQPWITFGPQDEAALPAPNQNLDGLAVLVVCPGQDFDKCDVYKFDVMAWPGQCQEWLKIKNTPLDPDGPTSDRNIDFMRRCIDACISNHKNCKKKTPKPTYVPTRLLDLGDYRASSAKLIECSQTLSLSSPGTQLQYATLSYCWGESLTLTTTTANKSKLETIGIEVQNMPATFQDAIYIAKQLGIRYLWIDALCIVQDDKDDWEVEAVMMCDVFAHSKVTISAAKTLSSAEHFLQRPIDETLTLDFHSTLKPDVFGQYSIQLEAQQFGVNLAQQDIAQSAWVSRAWVLQEEIMSIRQVIFGNKTLQFRCSQGTFVEDGRYYELDRSLVLHPSMNFWLDAVAAYSSRKLTYASDRLKAIAGVAKVLESFNPMKSYLVGLWQRHDFDRQLRWVCNEPSLSYTEMMELLRDRGGYIAPSWSWASRNTGVHYPWDVTHPVIRVIKSDLRASHKSSMVSVEFGSSISLGGHVSQTPVEPSSGNLVVAAGRWPYRLSHKWEVSSTYGHTDFWLDWVPNKDDDKESKFQHQLCLLVTSMNDLITEKVTGGLILTPVLDTESEVLFYYRVGVFQHLGDRQRLMSQPKREIAIR